MLNYPIDIQGVEMPIPSNFNSDGLLDPGAYDATFADIRASILVTGNGSSPSWDSSWRNELVSNAELLVKELWSVGFNDIFLDGSFVEDKDRPNDIDGYFDTNLSALNINDMQKAMGLISALNNLNPHKIWNWDPRARRKVHGFAKKQLPMWIFYKVELYPHFHNSSGKTGVPDKHGNDLKFPSAFRQSRNNFKPKGIVKVIQGGLYDQN